MSRMVIDFLKSRDYLQNSDITICKIHLPQYLDLIDYLSDFLDSKELERSKRYYKEKDKNRFIICRTLLKFILASYAKIDVQKIYISQGVNKKPYLESYPDLHFNVSHSEDYAIIGISNQTIGVDVEMINTNYDFKDLISTVFNENEINLIEHSVDKNQTFYNLWTRKEAFVKALGKGIDDDFFKIPCIEDFYVDLPLGDAKSCWHINSFEIAENYVGALTYETKDSSPKHISYLTLPTQIKDFMSLRQ